MGFLRPPHIIPSYATIKHFTALLSTLGASLPEWNVPSWRNAFMDIVYITKRCPKRSAYE